MSLHSDFNAPYVTVVGAGAIGRAVASMLCRQGCYVELVARDSTIADLKKSAADNGGLLFRASDLNEDVSVSPHLIGYSELKLRKRAPDYVFYAVKANYLADTVGKTKILLVNPGTRAVFLQGGMQWWCGHGRGFEDISDPQGAIAAQVNLDNAYAGLVSFGAKIDQSQLHISQLSSNAPITFGAVGNIDKGKGAILSDLEKLFDNGLVQPSVTQDVFQTIWLKAIGSFVMSSFALVSGKTLGGMTSDPGTLKQMVEAAGVFQKASDKLGIDVKKDYKTYFKKLGDSKPDHMMSITKGPGEWDVIVSLPMLIAKELGCDVSKLEPLVARSKEAAEAIALKLDSANGGNNNSSTNSPKPDGP